MSNVDIHCSFITDPQSQQDIHILAGAEHMRSLSHRGVLQNLLNTVKCLLHPTEALKTDILASRDTPVITYVSHLAEVDGYVQVVVQESSVLLRIKQLKQRRCRVT